MDTASIISAYRRYAQIYDYLFGKVFDSGRQLVVERMNCQPGQTVLEVGVGTGLSLPLYPSDAKIIGIDISPHMLAKAEKRVTEQKLTHVQLQLMDAQHLTFKDNTFDKVVAMYVATVVPSPRALLSEMKRVCKPGGDLFIVNHFSHDHPLAAGLERIVSPFSQFLGFRSVFSLEKFIHDTALEVEDMTSLKPFGYWRLIHARNDHKLPVVASVMEDTESTVIIQPSY